MEKPHSNPEYPVQQQMEQEMNTSYENMLVSMNASALLTISKQVVKNIKTV